MIDFLLCYYTYYGNNYYMTTETILLFALIALMIIGSIIQAALRSSFNKYSKVRSSSGMSSEQVAEQLLYKGGCNTQVLRVSGSLTDHFNPKSNTVGLSEIVYGSDSISALAVAAHEIGHVMQYKEEYLPIKIRNTILPVANFGSRAAPFIVIIGLFMGLSSLSMIGVWLYAAVFGFQLVTLPVEFNASSRAIAMLTEGNYISYSERPAAKKVLRMAAMTYVVATLSTLISLVRLFLTANNSRRR